MTSNIPAELRYAQSHEWVRVDGDIATIGITDHAQQELTDIVFVELPEIGRNLRVGDTSAVVESVKTASDIYSPVTGEVIEVNHLVASQPELVNSSAYGEGWLYKIKMSNSDELSRLLSAEDYRTQIAG